MNTWSVSSIRGFHTCQLQWWFRRQGTPEEFRPVALVEGIVLHAALAFHLKTQQAVASPSEADAIEVLDASWFSEECGSAAEIRYGRLDRSQVLERLRRLYRHWRANVRLEGEIAAVEEELRVQLPGVNLPLLGYADLVLRTPAGDRVVDFKSSASRPCRDDLMDALDLQKLAMTRGWEVQTGRTVTGWSWSYLVKTKEPQLVDVELPVASDRRDQELGRLAGVVNPTLRLMSAVLTGRLAAVPTQSYSAMCEGCPYRRACAIHQAASGDPHLEHEDRVLATR